MLGTDIYTTSKLLGHNHVATTEIYAKVIDKKKVESMTNLDMDWLDTYYIYMKEERNVSKAVYDHLHLLRPILDGFLTKIRKQKITVDAFGRSEVLGFLMYMRNWKAEKKGKLSQGTMVAYQQRFVAVFNVQISQRDN